MGLMRSLYINNRARDRVFNESVTTVKLKDHDDDQGTFVCDEEPHMLAPELGYGYYPLLLGERLDGGKYEIVRKLGWAGYSSVWLASVCRYFFDSLLS
jgi:serine/threonine-protein kinase SRPK3